REGPLVSAALTWLAGLATSDATADALSIRSDHPAARTSLAPAPSIGRGNDAARDLSLALVRSGLAGARRGAIDDALRRVRAVEDPRIARWAARVEHAIAIEDLPLLARLARGGLMPPGPAQQTRVELHVVEIAREHLDAARPRALERRHLIDLGSGARYAEDLDAASPGGSVGPCPRALEIGLAELWDDGGQASLRILQYTTAPSLSSANTARLLELVTRELDAALEQVERALRASPAFAEPVVLLEIARWEEGLCAFDVTDHAVPWSPDEDPAACARLAEVVADRPPRFVVMRAVPRRGAHAFVPLSCGVERGHGELEIVRLRG
ncbi:MAG: hypothetical protein J0L92_37330, partial [Deltaproteobacteria bacterium]|nr:hypothetical protein [Deltaproteobacteria bacterium]